MAKFAPGQSGNPAGRAKGAVSKLTRALKDIEADVPGILAAMVEAAKGGDTRAAKLLLDRVLPVRRPVDAPVTFPLAVGTDDLAAAAMSVLHGMAAGSVTPDAARSVADVLAVVARLRDGDGLAAQMAELETLIHSMRTPDGRNPTHL